MVDPISIGIAFTAIQSVVGNIKSAINTGKDINNIIKDIGQFLSLSADIDRANNQLKVELLTKSSSQLEAMAFETAMIANEVANQRKQLKELLIWSGNGHIWDDMIAEHTRLLKEKRELEEKERLEKKKRKQRLIYIGFVVLTTIASLFVIIPITYIAIKLAIS